MKIGDRCFVHGHVDEIRKDTVIVRNKGGYFGTDPGEVIVVNDMAHPNWIPCSERLPEVHETGNSFSGVYMQSYPVLVYGVPEGEEECSFHVVTYCDDLNGYTYWSTELDAVTIDGVKAWMPLPEPYKGGDSE